MKIFPAIDIIGGAVVRLQKGDYGTVKQYSLTVEEAAKAFAAAGAKYLHAVDLDGAKSGNADNANSVKRIIYAGQLFVEIGGGIRTERQIEDYIQSGAGRVILGTAAVRDFPFVERAVKKHGGKIAVGVDAVDGKVAISGWREVTDINAFDFCLRLADAGVKSVIYTDISRDGMLSGTNLSAYERLVKIAGLEITASGGITYLDELRALKEMGVHAAILGKALYEGKIDLAEAVKIGEGT